MTTVSLNYAEMTLVAGRLDAKQQQMATALARLKTIADALVASDFKTVQASPAFDTTVAETVQSMGKAIGAVTSFAEVLRGAADAYRETDEQLAQQIGGGGATSTLELDMGEIDALRANLTSTQRAFEGVHGLASALDAGVLGHDGLAGAVHDFAHDWEKHRKEIIKNTDDIGEAVTNIDTNFTQVDTDLNSALKG
jgi:WXG100 family type VII secretion target